MTCVVCGNPSTYWLCSNECARRYLDTGHPRDCAICSFDPKTRQLGTLSTNRICRRCRQAPENADWIRGRREEPDDFIETRIEERKRWRNEQDNPLPDLTPRYVQIAKMVLEGERVSYVRTDRQGRRRGIRSRWQPYTSRRIAELVGCTRWDVEAVIKSIGS